MSKLRCGDLVTPIDYTPIWSVPGDVAVGQLNRKQIGIVLATRIDPQVGWTELQILHAGVVGWVLQDHVRKVR